ncbi:glycosyltransferase family 2 protein [Runella sp.]|uniref:glycosyltransferase family 2 protein n=1 Tax=Runella sp. TaxID=1960881 RepID=UPI003D0FCD15
MIEYVKSSKASSVPLFSIIIPTWNNLPYLQTCIRSIRQNSAYAHQIVLHINEGKDGTSEWAQTEGLDYSYSPENVGICLGCNAAFSLTEAEYIVYMNDDMYACPDWDMYLYQAIKEYGKEDFYFSGTQIERYPNPYGYVIGGHNYGDTVQNFQETKLLQEYKELAVPDWQGASFPPSVMHRHTWNLIGGFSIEFSPGMYSDPDISRKMWEAGIRNFKGIGNSLVYHFGSKSVSRIAHNPGRKQFLRKWGVTARTFYDFYLNFYSKNSANFARSNSFTASSDSFRFKLKLLSDRIRLLFW